jgi:hypothetical protein
MKLHTQIFTLCDYASVSREGKLSINGIFDELRVTQFPGGIPHAFLVATIAGLPNKRYQLKINLERESDKFQISSMSVDAVTSANGKNNLIFEMPGLGFEKPGLYRFVMYHGDNEVGSTVVNVINVNQSDQFKYKLTN